MERYFWIGTNKDGKEIRTMTLTNEPPKELILPHDSDLGLPDEIYNNFIPVTKEEILEKQRKNLETNDLNTMQLENVIKKIESFRELKQDWNGYDAEPFSDKLIDKAICLAKQLKPVPKVFPTANHSIQFEWEKDGIYIEIEVFKDSIKLFGEAQHRGESVYIEDN